MLTSHNCWCNFGRGHYEAHFFVINWVGDSVEVVLNSMPTHISVWGYMYPLVFPFGGTCSFLRVHIF